MPMDALDAAAGSLVHLFDDVADRHADRVAIELPPGAARPDRQTTTYTQLQAWADAVAAALGPVASTDAIVAVHLGRAAASLYAAQLGAFRAGMAFTCLDPKFPDDHIRRVLEDAQPAAI